RRPREPRVPHLVSRHHEPGVAAPQPERLPPRRTRAAGDVEHLAGGGLRGVRHGALRPRVGADPVLADFSLPYSRAGTSLHTLSRCPRRARIPYPRRVPSDSAAPPAVTARRILVAGTSGAGKTTLAGRVSGALGLPYTELDSLYHGT